MSKPTDYPIAPNLFLETQLYTQRLSDAAGNDNFRFSLSDIIAFLATQNIVISQGIYSSDEAAGLGGVAIGTYYETGVGHVDGLPPGVIKKRLI